MSSSKGKSGAHRAQRPPQARGSRSTTLFAAPFSPDKCPVNGQEASRCTHRWHRLMEAQETNEFLPEIHPKKGNTLQCTSQLCTATEATVALQHPKRCIAKPPSKGQIRPVNPGPTANLALQEHHHYMNTYRGARSPTKQNATPQAPSRGSGMRLYRHWPDSTGTGPASPPVYVLIKAQSCDDQGGSSKRSP